MGGSLVESDSQLVEACIAGERSAFEALYGEHAGRVRAYLLRSGFSPADADDLLRRLAPQAPPGLATFDAGRGRFGNWLSTIARNVARRHWARRPQPDNFDPELAEEVLAAEDNPGSSPELREQIDILQDCIGQLPQDLLAVVRLRYVQGRTTRGIGSITGLPESTVRFRLQQARDALERCLRQKGVLEV